MTGGLEGGGADQVQAALTERGVDMRECLFGDRIRSGLRQHRGDVGFHLQARAGRPPQPDAGQRHQHEPQDQTRASRRHLLKAKRARCAASAGTVDKRVSWNSISVRSPPVSNMRTRSTSRWPLTTIAWIRSEEHTSVLHPLMRISYAVFRLIKH